MQWFDRRPPLNAHARRAGLLLVLLAGLVPAPVGAQVPVESSGGTRALGMGGAFTAVADDATAAWWNPAGLSSLLADGVIDVGADDLAGDADQPLDAAGAWRARPFAIAVALPMAAISFNRLTVRDIRPAATGAAGAGREDPAAEPRVRTFASSSVGVTVAQSLGDWAVVGSTLRLVRAGAAGATVSAGTSVDTALDAAGRLDTADRTVADVDVGALAFAGPVRLAVVGRNLGGHRYETGGGNEDAFRVERNVRVGAAIGTGPAWARRPWTLAVDADLTTTHAADGERRSLALGAERWIGHSQRFGLRAGARLQTVGDARPVGSGGASVALMKGVFVEGQVTGGGDAAVSGWTLAGRVTF